MDFDLSTLEFEDVKQTATDLVADAPDFVYTAPGRNKCLYVYNNQPSCIVGQILASKGVPLEMMSEWDKHSACGIDDVLPVQTDPNVVKFLTVLQGRQDDCEPWGVALEAANEAVDSL